MTKSPTSPKNGADLRRQLLEQYEFDSAFALVMIDTAAAAFDEAIEAERITKKVGLTVKNSRGLVPNPAVHIAQAARHRMIRALRALDLEV